MHGFYCSSLVFVCLSMALSSATHTTTSLTKYPHGIYGTTSFALPSFCIVKKWFYEFVSLIHRNWGHPKAEPEDR